MSVENTGAGFSLTVKLVELTAGSVVFKLLWFAAAMNVASFPSRPFGSDVTTVTGAANDIVGKVDAKIAKTIRLPISLPMVFLMLGYIL
jgi:hypothetical protein